MRVVDRPRVHLRPRNTARRLSPNLTNERDECTVTVLHECTVTVPPPFSLSPFSTDRGTAPDLTLAAVLPLRGQGLTGNLDAPAYIATRIRTALQP